MHALNPGNHDDKELELVFEQIFLAILDVWIYEIAKSNTLRL